MSARKTPFARRTVPATVLAVATGAGAKRAKPRHLEHDMQVALFQQLDADPRTRDALIYAVPNAGGYSGGFQSNAARASRMKGEGVRKGPPDINVDEARGGYHGLRVELKVIPNKPTPEQESWMRRLFARGYLAAVCTTREQAFSLVVNYLSLQATP